MRSIARSRSRPARSSPIARPDLTNTSPVVDDRPASRNGREPGKIVSLDPWGHRVAEDFATEIAEGIDIRPTIAITKARLTMPEIARARWRRAGSKVDGDDRAGRRRRRRHQGAIDPVWYLPGVAERFGVERRRAAPHAVRADRRHVSGAGHAARPVGVPAADRRHHALHLRRPGRVWRQAPHADLPRARRVQRLGRVRLRHLHLPALSHPRHRGVRHARRRTAASASSSTTARKAARSAR